MTVQDMITELNDHGFTDESSIAKVRVLQHTIYDIEGREPWPFSEDTIDLTYNGGADTPTNFPTTFRATLKVTNSFGDTLRPLRLDEFEDTARGQYTLGGLPMYYYFIANTMKVWPVPVGATTLRMRYLKWSGDIDSTTVEAGILIPRQYHRLIVYGALWKLYDMEDDPELASRFEGHYENGLGQMRSTLWSRQYDQPDHILVADTDDWDQLY